MVDGIIGGVVKYGKKLLGKLKKKDKKGEDDTRTDAEKKADVHAAVTAGDALAKQPNASVGSVRKGLDGLRAKYKLTVLDLVKDGKDKFHIHGKINPEDDGDAFTLLNIVTVDIQGKPIKCAVSDASIVPIDKVLIYGTGKVKPLTDAESEEQKRLQSEHSAEYQEKMANRVKLPRRRTIRWTMPPSRPG